MKSQASAVTLFLVRLGVLAVVGLLCTVTIIYCTSVYFDQNAALQEMLSCAQRHMNASNVTYWLDGGTLLGAMRHRRFVVWDGDVTLGAISNVTGGLYDAMVSLAADCQLHFTPPPRIVDEVAGVGWYLYNSKVGLKIMEWIPSSEDVLRHGTSFAHSVDTFIPLRPCGIHALWSACPNDGAKVLEDHFGADWGNTTLMSLF